MPHYLKRHKTNGSKRGTACIKTQIELGGHIPQAETKPRYLFDLNSCAEHWDLKPLSLYLQKECNSLDS